MFLLLVLVSLVSLTLQEIKAMGNDKYDDNMLIIAHRGASGMFPEHTSIAYKKAIEQGADFIECDVVITRDLKLVCSHDPWIGSTTNVANNSFGPPHADFTSRLRTITAGPVSITDYFTFDFTLAELKTLRRKQVFAFRDQSFNYKYPFVTFKEYLKIAKRYKVGVYPEIKFGAFTNQLLASLNVTVKVEQLLLSELRNQGFKPSSKVFLQTFELSTIRNYNSLNSRFKTIFLTNKESDLDDDDIETYKDLGIYGLGLSKNILIQGNETRHIAQINQELVNKIRSKGLEVHTYTQRNEHQFLWFDYGQDPYEELALFQRLGVSGVFTDFPHTMYGFNAYRAINTLNNLKTLLPMISDFLASISKYVHF